METKTPPPKTVPEGAREVMCSVWREKPVLACNGCRKDLATCLEILVCRTNSCIYCDIDCFKLNKEGHLLIDILHFKRKKVAHAFKQKLVLTSMLNATDYFEIASNTAVESARVTQLLAIKNKNKVNFQQPDKVHEENIVIEEEGKEEEKKK